MGLKHNLEELVDIPKLTGWLDDNIPQLGDGSLTVELISGGYSNVVIGINRGDRTMVLRRPPATPPPGAERTVLREARVLSALDGTNVPHPKTYGACEDASVIGAPFYVMELVEGWAAQIVDGVTTYPAPFDSAPCGYRVPYAVVDALVALANVDYKAIGLEGFGKPDNYLERQVDRWASQLASYGEKYNYAGRDLPGYDIVEKWLRENTPTDYKVGIIHGDVGTPNMLFAEDLPCRVNALIDWELSTVGDPMVDLGWFLGGLRDERMPDVGTSSLNDVSHWPSRQELVRYYGAGTGRDMSNFDYYLVLARFKAGCIMEYKVAQAAIGKLDKEAGEFFSGIVLECFASAAEIVKRVG